MANWDLIEVVSGQCDECGIDNMMCNVYRTKRVCQCLKCQSMGFNYALKYVCGGCMGKWLKSRDMDNAE